MGGFRVRGDIDIAAWAGRAPAAARGAVRSAGEVMLMRATSDAPRRTGALRASGYALQDGMRSRVGFTAPYALLQHEGRFRHPGGGQAGFLRRAAASREAMDALARAFREGMGKG